MIKLILLVVAIAAGVYAYNDRQNNPVDIDSPVYVESRVNIEIPQVGRDLEYVFVGEMVSQEDCQKRSQRYLKKLFEDCDTCNLKKLHCKSNLANRYKNLFKGKTTYTTYLSLDKGNRHERNGRMVIWGLTEQEAEMACGHIKQKIKEKYKGTVHCVAGRLS